MDPMEAPSPGAPGGVMARCPVPAAVRHPSSERVGCGAARRTAFVGGPPHSVRVQRWCRLRSWLVPP